MSLFGKVTFNIGLDVSRSGIRMVQFRRNSLVRIACMEIPASVRKGSNGEFLQFVTKNINALWREGNFKGRNVSSNLTGPDEVALLFFTLPRMKGKDFEGAVAMEIRKSSNFPIESSIFDFYSRSVPYHDDQLRMVTAVSEGRVIGDKIAALEKAKFLILRFDIAGHAIENLLVNFAGETDEKEASLFLDVGSDVTTMNFFVGNVFQFSRELSWGTDELINSFAKPIVTEKGRINLSFEDAEAIEKEHGIIREDNKELINGSIPAVQLSAMMRPIVERILREVDNSISQFRREFNAKVGKIFLYGGAGKLKGLDKVLLEHLKIEVSVFDPFSRMTVQLSEKQEKLLESFKLDFVVASGLALDSERKFNILPAQVKLFHRLSTVRTGIVTGIVLFAACLGFLYLTMCLKVQGYQKLLKRNELYLMSIKNRLKATDELKKLEAKIAKREKIISNIGEGPIWYGVLKEISNIIPSGIELESISIVSSAENRIGLELNGNLISKESHLSGFLMDLNSSPFFEDVVLISRREENGEINFEIEYNLIYQD